MDLALQSVLPPAEADLSLTTASASAADETAAASVPAGRPREASVKGKAVPQICLTLQACDGACVWLIWFHVAHALPKIVVVLHCTSSCVCLLYLQYLCPCCRDGYSGLYFVGCTCLYPTPSGGPCPRDPQGNPHRSPYCPGQPQQPPSGTPKCFSPPGGPCPREPHGNPHRLPYCPGQPQQPSPGTPACSFHHARGPDCPDSDLAQQHLPGSLCPSFHCSGGPFHQQRLTGSLQPGCTCP